jgi:FixJ family two-component response regulator
MVCMFHPVPSDKIDRLKVLRRRYELATDRLSVLTDREREVYKLVVAGLQTKAIAQKLGISRRTVDNHRANILRALKPESPAALFRLAFESELFED